MTLARSALLSAPALLLAGVLGGSMVSVPTLALWASALCFRERGRAALYPRQRRQAARRFFLGFSAGCPCLMAGEKLLYIAQSAAPLRACFPAWAGAAFFAAVLCRRFVLLRVGKRAAWALTALFCVLSLALYRL